MNHHPHNQLTDFPSPEPHICCIEAPGKARQAGRKFTCHPKCRLASVHCFPWSYCLLPGTGRIQNPLAFVFFLIDVPLSVSGREFHQMYFCKRALLFWTCLCQGTSFAKCRNSNRIHYSWGQKFHLSIYESWVISPGKNYPSNFRQMILE